MARAGLLVLVVFVFVGAAACNGGSDAPATPTPTPTPTPAPITVSLQLSVSRPTAASINTEKGEPTQGAMTALAIQVLTQGGNATVSGSCTLINLLGDGSVYGNIDISPPGPIAPGTPFSTVVPLSFDAPFPLPDPVGGFNCQVTGTDERGGSVSVSQSITVPGTAVAPDVTPCAPNDSTLCLLDGRFKVQVDWRNEAGETGAGRIPPDQRFDDGGRFWFFNPDNTELLVQMLNACQQPNPRFWVFAAGLTNVEVVINVTDTQTGVRQPYRNPLGTPFEQVLDTDAFATCP